MSPFIETIRIENGQIHNLPYHNRRMNETRRDVLHQTGFLDLSDCIQPGDYRERTKCRVEYDKDILKVEYASYHIRPVSSLRLVADDEADYRYKSTDRSVLNRLFDLRETEDDVLIVRRMVDRHFYLQYCALERKTMDYPFRTVTGRNEKGFFAGSGRDGCR